MKKYILPCVLIFSLAVNIAATGTLIYNYWRENSCPAGLPGYKKPLGRFMREDLHLGKAEIARIQSLFSQDQEKLLSIKDHIRQARQFLFDLLAEDTFDSDKIDRQIEKIAALQAQMEKIVINRIVKIKADFPETNQKKLLEFIRRRFNDRPFHKAFRNSGRGGKGRR